MQMLSPVHVQAEKSNRGIRTTIVGSVAANVQAVEGGPAPSFLGAGGTLFDLLLHIRETSLGDCVMKLCTEID